MYDKKILCVGPGRDWFEIRKKYKNSSMIFVDKMFKQYVNNSEDNWFDSKDIFEFLENYLNKDINLVTTARFMEHVAQDRVQYLLYLFHCVCSENAKLEIIVPDYIKVADNLKYIEAINTPKEFNDLLIKLSTEIFNTSDDPHQSVWTPFLAKYYIELENLWKVDSINDVTIDGRSWYIKIEASKITKGTSTEPIINGENE